MTREEINNRLEELTERLDEISWNEIYNGIEADADEVKAIRAEIKELEAMDAEPTEFEFSVVISGKATISAETEDEAIAILYDAVKNHPDMVVYSVDIS